MVQGDPKGYYAALGLSETADVDDVKAAFLRRAKKLHPDAAFGRDTTVAFQEVHEAYATLSDPLRRRSYDSEGSGAAPNIKDLSKPKSRGALGSIVMMVAGSFRFLRLLILAILFGAVIVGLADRYLRAHNSALIPSVSAAQN